MQALGVVITPTRKVTSEELNNLAKTLNIPTEPAERTQSLSRALQQAVSRIGKAEWTVAGNWNVTIETHRTNQQNSRKATYAIHRVCRPRKAQGDTIYNDVVGKIILHTPRRKLVKGTRLAPVDLNSARLQTLLIPEENLPGIHPEEWTHIRNYLGAIVADYKDRTQGWLEGAQLRHHINRTTTEARRGRSCACVERQVCRTPGLARRHTAHQRLS